MNTFKERLSQHDNISHPGSTRDEILHWNNRYRKSLTRCGLKIVESEDELPPNIHDYIQAPIVCPGSFNPWKQPSFIVAMTDEEWAAAQEGTRTPRAPAVEPASDMLTLSFTRHEWRLLAAAAQMVKPTAFIQDADRATIRSLAKVIAKKTGQAS